jgi:NAD(P)-dependent dehydrogenase (short-subunit alcohol dehydrogenase family)
VVASGASKATALQLIELGPSVSLERLTAVKAVIERGAAGAVGDLSDMEQVRDLADQVNQSGPVDVVIHNAGVFSGREWLATSDDPKALTNGGYWYHSHRRHAHDAVYDQPFQDPLLDHLARVTGGRLT